VEPPIPARAPDLPGPDEPLPPSGPVPVSPQTAPQAPRARALLEVVLCCGYPTQLLIGTALAIAGWPPFTAEGVPRLGPLVALALLDTIVLLVLIAVLLHAGGERLWPLLSGARPVLREAGLGLLLVPVIFVGVGLTVLAVRRLLPWTHNVPLNPFEALLRTPAHAGLFAVIVIVAGGLREEVQRVFLLHRFEQHLGGAAVGLVVLSLAFGAGHYVQGWDASIVTGLLGLAWGWIYLRRRSAIAPIVSHAGYNAAQILQATLALPGLRV
jgi:membrane protease YdiL (CAAX protease family)